MVAQADGHRGISEPMPRQAEAIDDPTRPTDRPAVGIEADRGMDERAVIVAPFLLVSAGKAVPPVANRLPCAEPQAVGRLVDREHGDDAHGIKLHGSPRIPDAQPYHPRSRPIRHAENVAEVLPIAGLDAVVTVDELGTGDDAARPPEPSRLCLKAVSMTRLEADRCRLPVLGFVAGSLDFQGRAINPPSVPAGNFPSRRLIAPGGEFRVRRKVLGARRAGGRHQARPRNRCGEQKTDAVGIHGGFSLA